MSQPPKEESETLLTIPDVPETNPENVKAAKKIQNRLIISICVVFLVIIGIVVILVSNKPEKEEEFPFGSYYNDTTRTLTFPSNMTFTESELKIHSFDPVEHIVFFNSTFKSVNTLSIYDLRSVKSITWFGDVLFPIVTSMDLHDLPQLESINITGKYMFKYLPGVLSFQGHPKLNTLSIIGGFLFPNITSLSFSDNAALNTTLIEVVDSFPKVSKILLSDLPSLKSCVLDGYASFTKSSLVIKNVCAEAEVEIYGYHNMMKADVLDLSGTSLSLLAIRTNEAFQNTTTILFGRLSRLLIEGEGVFRDIQRMDLRDTFLKVFEVTRGSVMTKTHLSFDGAQYLEEIKLNGYGTQKEVKSFAIRNVPSLRLLEMHGHDVITKSLSFIIENVPKLEKIDVKGDRIALHSENFTLHALPMLKEFVCEGRDSFNLAKRFSVWNCDALERISIHGEGSFVTADVVSIEDLPSLGSVELEGKYVFSFTNSLVLRNLPKLKVFKAYGEYLFRILHSMTIKGMDNLETIEIMGDFALLETQSFELSDLPSLTDFVVNGNGILKASEIVLRDLPKLQRFEMIGDGVCEDSSSFVVSKLSPNAKILIQGDRVLSAITSFDLSKCGSIESMTVEGMDCIKNTVFMLLGGLKELVFRNSGSFGDHLTISDSDVLEHLLIDSPEQSSSEEVSSAMCVNDNDIRSNKSLILKNLSKLQALKISGFKTLCDTHLIIEDVNTEAVVEVNGEKAMYYGSLDLSKCSIKQLLLNGKEALHETNEIIFGDMESLVISGHAVLNSLHSMSLMGFSRLREIDISGDEVAYNIDNVTLSNLPELQSIHIRGKSSFASASAFEMNTLPKLSMFTVENEYILASLGQSKGYIKLRNVPIVSQVDLGPGVDLSSTFYRMKYFYKGPSVSEALFNSAYNYVKQHGNYKDELEVIEIE